MKTIMIRKQMTAALVGTCALFVIGTAQAQTTLTLWQDNDPASSASTLNGGLSITPTSSGAEITGSHTVVGDVVDLNAVNYSSIGPVTLPIGITSAEYGQNYSFSVDYYIPTTSTLAASAYFYLQMNFLSGATVGANIAPGPYLGLANADNTWHSMSVTGTVPSTVSGNPTDGVQAYLVLYDGGSPAPGTAFYIDNVLLTVNSVPEPSTFALAGLGLLGLFVRRFRR